MHARSISNDAADICYPLIDPILQTKTWSNPKCDTQQAIEVLIRLTMCRLICSFFVRCTIICPLYNTNLYMHHSKCDWQKTTRAVIRRYRWADRFIPLLPHIVGIQFYMMWNNSCHNDIRSDINTYSATSRILYRCGPDCANVQAEPLLCCCYNHQYCINKRGRDAYQPHWDKKGRWRSWPDCAKTVWSAPSLDLSLSFLYH